MWKDKNRGGKGGWGGEGKKWRFKLGARQVHNIFFVIENCKKKQINFCLIEKQRLNLYECN